MPSDEMFDSICLLWPHRHERVVGSYKGSFFGLRMVSVLKLQEQILTFQDCAWFVVQEIAYKYLLMFLGYGCSSMVENIIDQLAASYCLMRKAFSLNCSHKYLGINRTTSEAFGTVQITLTANPASKVAMHMPKYSRQQ